MPYVGGVLAAGVKEKDVMAKRTLVTPIEMAANPTASPALRVGEMVFVSAQTPTDPATGRVVGDAIEQQAEQVLANLAAVLNAAGCTINDCVQVRVYLADPSEQAAFDRAYQSRFREPRPADHSVRHPARRQGATRRHRDARLGKLSRGGCDPRRRSVAWRLTHLNISSNNRNVVFGDGGKPPLMQARAERPQGAAPRVRRGTPAGFWPRYDVPPPAASQARLI